jgi:sulfur carrier protein ThiS
MKVFIERTREHKLSHAKDVSSLLDELHFIADEVLVMKNNVLVTEDEPLLESDEVKILSVISGG